MSGRISLQVMRIPHVVFNPKDDMRLILQDESGKAAQSEAFDDLKRSIDDIIDRTVGTLKDVVDRAVEFSKALWVFRRKHDPFVLGSGTKGDYEDMRGSRLAEPDKRDDTTGVSRWCGEASNDALEWIKDTVKQRVLKLKEKICGSVGFNGDESPEALSVLERSLVWSQLLWSDPGQVFFDSPIIVMRMGSSALARVHPFPENIVEALLTLDGLPFSVTVYWTILQGGVVDRAGKDERWYRLSPKWTENEGSRIRDYAQAGQGRGRFLGLDVRACPSMLRRCDGGSDRTAGRALNADDVLHVCGLPWDRLGESASMQSIVKESDLRVTSLRRAYSDG